MARLLRTPKTIDDPCASNTFSASPFRTHLDFPWVRHILLLLPVALTSVTAAAEAGQAIQTVAEAAPEIANAITSVIQTATDAANAKTSQDNIRTAFTQGILVSVGQAKPGYAILVDFTAHDPSGLQGVDSITSVSCPVSPSSTLSYILYIFKNGTFIQTGDGGYINWAFSGNFRRTNAKKKTTLVFS